MPARPKAPTRDTARRTNAPRTSGLTYAGSGVSIDAGDAFAASIGTLLRKTHGPRVIDNPGGFAGMLRLDYNEKLFQRNYKDPVLVACTDGVGTKVKLAIDCHKYDTVGIDLVAMSVNDLIVLGAEPLLFLDYIAVHKVEQQMLHDIVKGVSEGCRQAGCALLGGETAEMNDLYAPGDFDLAGFAVGVAELKRVTNAERVRPGDVVLGLASSGVHSNGYSLVRRIITHAKLKLDKTYPELADDRPLGEVLLEPTRIYAASVIKTIRSYKVKQVVTAMAHITGGGLAGNLERSIPEDCDAQIRTNAWDVPPLFRFLQKHGGVDEAEMRRVFNMGVGYCLVVRPTFAEGVKKRLEKAGETVFEIGKITKGKGRVIEK